MHIKSTYTLNIFIAYHPRDQDKFEELYMHLQDLNTVNKGYIINKIWYDGKDLSLEGQEIVRELTDAADMVLLLLSEDSILSPYFSGRALQVTLEQHRNGRSIVVPIILNTCWWEDTAYKELEVLPRAGLPIYDSANIKNELFDQVIDELDIRLQKIRAQKAELEESYRGLLVEADAIFNAWEQHPGKLRAALPLYREALDHWREGFVPRKEVLEARIELCLREIDFRHYAKAAHEAYRLGDYQTCYYNCKDALNLRNDAVIRKLFEEVSQQLETEELQALRAPFDQHLQAAQQHFLALRWAEAEAEFKHALEFYEPVFEPKKEVIDHKIEICHRERLMETSMQEASQLYHIQQYAKSVDALLSAIRSINYEAFDHIDHMIQLVGFLEHVKRFREDKTMRWGYYDTKTNNVIIAPKYLAAYDFSENLAAVKKWEFWGYIDIEGNEIIPFEYDFAGHFRNGIAEVMQQNETFYINHKGQRVGEKEASEILKQAAQKLNAPEKQQLPKHNED